jgi:hypothetical protein
MGCCQPRKVSATKPLQKQNNPQASGTTIHFVQINNLASTYSSLPRDRVITTELEFGHPQSQINHLSMLRPITMSPSGQRLPREIQTPNADHFLKPIQKPVAKQANNGIKIINYHAASIKNGGSRVNPSSQLKREFPDTVREPLITNMIRDTAACESKEGNSTPETIQALEEQNPVILSSRYAKEYEHRGRELSLDKRYSLDTIGIPAIGHAKTEGLSSIDDLVTDPKRRRSMVAEFSREHKFNQQALKLVPDQASFDEISEDGNSGIGPLSPGKNPTTLSTLNELQDSFNKYSSQQPILVRKDKDVRNWNIGRLEYLRANELARGILSRANSADAVCSQVVCDNMIPGITGISGDKNVSETIFNVPEEGLFENQENENYHEGFACLGKIAECDSELEVSVSPEKKHRGSRLLAMTQFENDSSRRKSHLLEADVLGLPRRSSFGINSESRPQTDA